MISDDHCSVIIAENCELTILPHIHARSKTNLKLRLLTTKPALCAVKVTRYTVKQFLNIHLIQFLKIMEPRAYLGMPLAHTPWYEGICRPFKPALH